MAKTHSFDVALAEEFGIIESVILSNLCFWIEKNMHNGKNFHDGRYWVYNSNAAFEKLFPYLSRDQIRRALNKLHEKGVVSIGNFNKIGYDRTLWYSVCDSVFKTYSSDKLNINKAPAPPENGRSERSNDETPRPNGRMHVAEPPNAVAQTGTPAQLGNCTENEAKTSVFTENDQSELSNGDTPCPNGRMHVAEPPNAVAQTGESIARNRQMDSAIPPRLYLILNHL